ncbi:adenosylcobinamide-GDP ribazoletransferase [Pseudoduganella plicata]|uniref:Adenosylcobinamide-GDP ribazoletransferase n=1 Tax=Pseudoduganella plicata TaxID=321984 RepID=A0A4P7BJ46_9BURK|nr:adenosylcobinamide-GDP ribazoletransferase [Pseudoduganella plicata]QBQ38177.1 adenosylcobinamide-GDP ribazoletransferase [Pseudoduganella plicata]GGZ11351.1 adenosylcobinamide-GDP ribazoletransferase [Pseudoduganella plicata]
MAPLLHQLRLFFTALQFFTRLPVPRWVGFEPDWLHHASRYFPLVGLVVGAAAAAIYWAVALVLPPAVAVLLSTAASIYMTGAFHEDGFADACDGLGGGVTRERALEIMKDSRIGAYGAIGILLLLAVKCTALAHLPPLQAMAALIVAHPLSRLMAASLIWRMDYARAEGKAKPLAQQMSGSEFAIATLCCAPPLLLAALAGPLHWHNLAVGIAAMAATALWFARKCARRLGGYTGDCLGAVQQLCEAVFYLCVLAVLPG